jgi:hypothetical protein
LLLSNTSLPAGDPGMEAICKLLESDEDKHNLWLIYELGGTPLSKLLFETKGQFYNSERIYEVR